MALLDYIPTGEANAVTTAELLRLTGIPSVRALRKEIHQLREQGHIICASMEPPAGYYLAENPQEAARFVPKHGEPPPEIGRAIRAAKKYIQETGGESVDR